MLYIFIYLFTLLTFVPLILSMEGRGGGGILDCSMCYSALLELLQTQLEIIHRQQQKRFYV